MRAHLGLARLLSLVVCLILTLDANLSAGAIAVQPGLGLYNSGHPEAAIQDRSISAQRDVSSFPAVTTSVDRVVDASQNLLAKIAAISAGNDHTCALTTGGGVKCWGWNAHGQLGDGTTNDHLTPVDVSGLTSGMQAISAGNYHTCALTTGGGVQCWGHNEYGQLGDGTTNDRLTPVDVSGLTSSVQAISAGNYHTCALTRGGRVKCWGRNEYGQLGDGSQNDRLTPVDVIGLTSVVQAISAGGEHTCALTTSGGVKCWGSNVHGQLGDSTQISRPWPGPGGVTGLNSGVQAISAGWDHTCALTTGGGVKCWGYNGYGQLGDSTTIWRPWPRDVSGLTSGVQAIAAGYAHTCALTTGTGIKCWGHNGYGQLGDGTMVRRLTPVDVSGLTSGVQAISAGNEYTCAVATGGGAKCWGYNGYGQLGDGTTSNRWMPVDVSGLTNSDPTAIDAADLASQMPYPTSAPSTPLTLWINVRNSGTTTWTAASGYGWRGTEQWQGQTGTIDGAIAPDQTWAFSANITAPSQPGTYIYGFILQHNGVDFGPHFFIHVTVASSGGDSLFLPFVQH
jgi:alpha-tubulin suppressor-like RCC1 family protein